MHRVENDAMALFVVRHQHAAEHCPAHDPYGGAWLLNYLSRPNVRQHGIEIQGEAVVEGEHTLYFIVEAGDADKLRAFLNPFQAAGTLDIYPASTCTRVVASGGCGAGRRRAKPSGPDPKKPARTPSTPGWSCTAPIRSIVKPRFRRSSAASSCRTRISTSAITFKFRTSIHPPFV